MKKKLELKDHVLIPKHEKLSQKATKELLARYNIKVGSLPEILISDPAIAAIKPEVFDVIKITRHSPTAGTTVFYRVVTDGRGVQHE